MPAYTTQRLRVSPWETHLDDPTRRQDVKSSVRPMLSEAVMRYLPPTLALGPGPDPMEAWVEARRSAASVSLVETTEALVGLLFLFRPDTAREGDPMHLGYMLGEESWGQGYGSELISGLIEHLEPGPRSDLQAGVDIHNHASARILIKTGFVRAPEYCSQELDVYERSVGRAPVLDVSQPVAVK